MFLNTEKPSSLDNTSYIQSVVDVQFYARMHNIKINLLTSKVPSYRFIDASYSPNPREKREIE